MSMRKLAYEKFTQFNIENTLADCCSQLFGVLHSMNIDIKFNIHKMVDNEGISIDMYFPKENIWRTFNYEI